MIHLTTLPAVQPACSERAPGSARGATFRIETLGCKVNQYESQIVKEALERHGYRLAPARTPAALCVVNTCTVTAEADAKARQLIRRLWRQNPGAQTVVFGCYAARDPARLEELPGVVAVARDARELPDILQRFGVANWPTGITSMAGHRRAFVKVQDGCLLNCTFCIIPQVRPGLRSREREAILPEVARLLQSGYKEIVLTGIHLGHYGVENTRGKSGRPRYRLAHLVRDLDQLEGNWRLRLSSLEAAEADEEFVNCMATCKRLCPHFHLCLQSGSDAVLYRMKRRYKARAFLEAAARIRAAFEEPALSTDVIVGFPGESDADFERTLSVCQEAGVMKIHAFPYSARRGTPAAEFDGQVPEPLKRERMLRLVNLERELSQRYHQRLVGRQLSMLVEARPASQAGWVLGTACRYVPVEMPGTAAAIGGLFQVEAVETTGMLIRVLPGELRA
jgi:threonylcarbamoyladenosine tRNA methylthiotransferase MtaB